MKQSWQVFKRDVTRLFRVRKAWVIVIGVLITPALYAWFNINAFWDPYANTGNIKVAVANADAGSDSELTGDVNIGDQVVDQLADNEQLGWEFLGEAEAQRAVERGEVYAAIVIPQEFSEDLLSMTTGEFTQPALKYYVNEKASAIAPKITDVGASELDKQITSAFKEQVALAATEAVKDAGDSIELRLLDTRDGALNAFDKTSKTLDSARKNVAELQEGLESSRGTLSAAQSTLTDVNGALSDVQASVAEAQTLVTETQQQVVPFTNAVSAAYLKSTTLLADASSSAHVSVTQLTQELSKAGVRIDSALKDTRASQQAVGKTLGELQQLVDSSSLEQGAKDTLAELIGSLTDTNDSHAKVITQLESLSAANTAALSSVQSTADAMNKAVQGTNAAAAEVSKIMGSSMPAMNAAMSQLAASAGAFSSAIGSQQGVLAQAHDLLGGIDTQLASTHGVLESFDADLENIAAGVNIARSDVLALGAASDWGVLSTVTGLDPDQVAQFISSPVEVNEQIVFPIKSYGSAMSALFTNLSLWIGAFVLMVIFKIEVDTEGVPDVTVTQAYLGRFYLFGTLAALQALIVTIGNLVIGIQVVSGLAYVVTGVLIALAYVSIVYALCVAFGHIGRGLCILLVIMQIPGASGLYPIELMPGFFRAIYPLLPFSYGIDAMRETIAGFYGGHYWRVMAVLALMVALSFLLGLVLRRKLANFHLLFNREIASTDLLIGEKVQVVDRGYRLADVLHALRHRGEDPDEFDRRSSPFTRHYSTLLRSTFWVGVAGIFVLAVIAWALPGGKALLLGIWTLWCLLIMGFLVVIEYIKQSFDQASTPEGMAAASAAGAELREPALAVAGGAASRAAARQDARGHDTTGVDSASHDTTVRSGTAHDATGRSFAGDPQVEQTVPRAGAAPDATDDIDEVIASLFGDAAHEPDAPTAGSSGAAGRRGEVIAPQSKRATGEELAPEMPTGKDASGGSPTDEDHRDEDRTETGGDRS